MKALRLAVEDWCDWVERHCAEDGEHPPVHIATPGGCVIVLCDEALDEMARTMSVLDLPLTTLHYTVIEEVHRRAGGRDQQWPVAASGDDSDGFRGCDGTGGQADD